MGYRLYMYAINKNTVEAIKSLTYEELLEKYKEEDEDFFSLHNLPSRQLHNFGKMWDSSAERIYDMGIPLFDKEEVMKDLSDYHPYVVGREGLLEAITIYKEAVISYYKDLITDSVDGVFEHENKTAVQKQKRHVSDLLSKWERFPPINLNEESDEITNSWIYEYAIFELVRLLKTIDFNKETIIFYGY